MVAGCYNSSVAFCAYFFNLVYFIDNNSYRIFHPGLDDVLPEGEKQCHGFRAGAKQREGKRKFEAALLSIITGNVKFEDGQA